MNCKKAKKEYDRQRYLLKKAEYEAVHGPRNGPNQHTVSHRMTGTPEYLAWQGMRSRCNRPEDKSYSNYGGRGIKVCERWSSFDAFHEDMGPRPEGMSLDRFPNRDGDYRPDNCRWATPTEQTRNRRTTIQVEYQGETKTLAEWCSAFGLNYYTVHNRLRRFGWPVDRIFAPVPSAHNLKEAT